MAGQDPSGHFTLTELLLVTGGRKWAHSQRLRAGQHFLDTATGLLAPTVILPFTLAALNYFSAAGGRAVAPDGILVSLRLSAALGLYPTRFGAGFAVGGGLEFLIDSAQVHVFDVRGAGLASQGVNFNIDVGAAWNTSVPQAWAGWRIASRLDRKVAALWPNANSNSVMKHATGINRWWKNSSTGNVVLAVNGNEAFSAQGGLTSFNFFRSTGPALMVEKVKHVGSWTHNLGTGAMKMFSEAATPVDSLEATRWLLAEAGIPRNLIESVFGG